MFRASDGRREKGEGSESRLELSSSAVESRALRPRGAAVGRQRSSRGIPEQLHRSKQPFNSTQEERELSLPEQTRQGALLISCVLLCFEPTGASSGKKLHVQK